MAPSDEMFRSMARIVTAWEKPLLLSHARPDGDAMGSLLAMRSILRALGSAPVVALFDPVPENLAFMVTAESLIQWEQWHRNGGRAGVDGVLVMDTCTYSQLEPAAEWLRTIRKDASVPIVAVDHHVTRDDVAHHVLADESAAATCSILFDWARACEWPVTADVALALFVGIATDTGWFRFSNTDQRTLQVAADLVARGVIPNDLHEMIYQSESACRVRLLGAALCAMELLNGDSVAMMTIDSDMYRRTGTSPADTEGIINEPMKIASVQLSILLAAPINPSDPVKASFRSKGQINVAELAAGFGGGGHPRAAGARIPGPPDTVRTRILDAVQSLRR